MPILKYFRVLCSSSKISTSIILKNGQCYHRLQGFVLHTCCVWFHTFILDAIRFLFGRCVAVLLWRHNIAINYIFRRIACQTIESASAGWGGGTTCLHAVGNTPMTLGGKQANIHGVTGSCCFVIVFLLIQPIHFPNSLS